MSPLLRSPDARAAAAEARGFLLSALAEARAEGQSVMISIPAPLARPEVLLAALPREQGFFWGPPGRTAHSGVGATWRLDPRCPRAHNEAQGERPEVLPLMHQSAVIFAHLAVRAFPGCQVAAPRFFGGMAFAPGAADAPPWSAFGDGTFALPRWRYERTDAAAALSLTVAGELQGRLPQGDTTDGLAAELDILLTALARDASRAREKGASPSAEQQEASRVPAPMRITQMERGRWVALIEDILREIASGRFTKIVAARHGVVTLPSLGPSEIRDSAVLSRLSKAHPDCTAFAFRYGAATFLGATPERLISKRGAHVITEALAGSVPRDKEDTASAQDQAAALLGSDKDRREHALVVWALIEGLRPLCMDLQFAESPQVKRLRHVLHLHTPIRGRLRGQVHVLSLVSALHPTPAVGGVPGAEAVRWIREHEPQPRGWYAGPIGWFDAAGDGEFMVGIRSGLLVGQQALVYAGAGIVAGSDPDAEFAETALKQQVLLQALPEGLTKDLPEDLVEASPEDLTETLTEAVVDASPEHLEIG